MVVLSIQQSFFYQWLERYILRKTNFAHLIREKSSKNCKLYILNQLY